MTEIAQKNAEQKYCSDCGAVISAKAEICPKCGVRQSILQERGRLTSSASNGKSKLMAALFALFFGGIGVHKFYLGNIGWGIIYLLFCWTFIPALAGLVEGIFLLVISETDFNRKYNNVIYDSVPATNPKSLPTPQPVQVNTQKQDSVVELSRNRTELNSDKSISVELKNSEIEKTKLEEVICGKCGTENPVSEKKCIECGDYLYQYKIGGLRATSELQQSNPPIVHASENTKRSIKREYVVLGGALSGALILSIVLIFGNFHFISGSEESRLSKKMHFTFSETFVSYDEITGMPYIMAIQKYPLAIKALQRDGMIESDEDRERRIDEELERDRKMREAKIEAEMTQKYGIDYSSITESNVNFQSEYSETDSGISSLISDPSAHVQEVIKNWQDIKRNAFVSGNTSELSSVLTDKALTDTQGGVNWWRNNGSYHSITLNNLDVLDTQIIDNTATVRVRISETKNNSVEGRKTSTYNATYGLKKQGNNWYISSIAAD